jgi:hypothetical protein
VSGEKGDTMQDAESTSPGLDAAAARLDRAVAQLEARIAAALGQAKPATGGLFDHERATLAAELEAAKAREKELQAAGAEAAQALGRAIAEIRATLGEDAAADLNVSMQEEV